MKHRLYHALWILLFLLSLSNVRLGAIEENNRGRWNEPIKEGPDKEASKDKLMSDEC